MCLDPQTAMRLEGLQTQPRGQCVRGTEVPAAWEDVLGGLLQALCRHWPRARPVVNAALPGLVSQSLEEEKDVRRLEPPLKAHDPS